MKLLLRLALLFSLVSMGGAITPLSASAQETRERGLEVKIGATPEDAKANKQVNLWAILIGISRYKYGDQNLDGNQIPNLKDAADDAQEIHDFLSSPEGGAFRDVSDGGHMVLLKDDRATKVNVENALNTLKQAGPDDFFIIYIAAHGALVPTLDPATKTTEEIPYFVVYDTDLRNTVNTAVKMDIFRKIVSQIPAKKGLVLSDTCHSAGVQLAGRGLNTTIRANARYLDEMNKIPRGVGFISAADQTELSYERDDLGSGVFTYCMLQGLRGDADTNQDGKVTFQELKDYLRDKVPELTENKEHPQYNTTTIEANYIPISVVRYPGRDSSSSSGELYGTLVIKTPDLDGVQVSMDGTLIGTLDTRTERTVRVKTGSRNLSFVKGTMKRTLQASVDPGKSKLVEVNLSFSEGDEDALVEPNDKYLNVYLHEDKEPAKEAKEYFQKGVDSFNKQKFDSAIDLLTKAVQTNNGAYADALVYRGRAEQSLGRKEAAIASFQAALALKPTDFETRTLLDEARFNAGFNVDEVVTDLRDITNRHHTFDYAYVVLGDVLFWRHDFIGAERQLRRAILINPKSPPAHLILADVLTYQDSKAKQKESVSEAEKALQLFDEVSRKQVSAAKGLKYLSISHVIFGGGRYINDSAMAEAHHILAKAIVRMVERDDTLQDRDSLLDKARQHIQESLKLARVLTDKHRLVLALDTSAQIYLLKGDVTHAIDEGESALKSADSLQDLKGFPDAHFTLYSAYSSAQKYSKAADHLKSFIDGYGSRLSSDEKAAYQEELNRLLRAAGANRQK